MSAINVNDLNTRTHTMFDQFRSANDKGRDTLNRLAANGIFRDDKQVAVHFNAFTQAVIAASGQLAIVVKNLKTKDTPDLEAASAAVDSIQQHIEDMQFETDCLNTLMDELETA